MKMKLTSLTKTLATAVAVAITQLGQSAQAKENIPGVVEQPAAYFYTGKPYDSDLGSYTFNARNYNPEINRWTSADPSGFPDGVNNNIYVKNSTTTNVDPNGLWTVESTSPAPSFDWVYGSYIADGTQGTYYQYRLQKQFVSWGTVAEKITTGAINNSLSITNEYSLTSYTESSYGVNVGFQTGAFQFGYGTGYTNGQGSGHAVSGTITHEAVQGKTLSGDSLSAELKVVREWSYFTLSNGKYTQSGSWDHATELARGFTESSGVRWYVE